MSSQSASAAPGAEIPAIPQAGGDRPPHCVLLKVKRRNIDEQNPSIISLQRFVSMDLYPEDLTLQSDRSARQRLNSQPPNANELVSLFGNLDTTLTQPPPPPPAHHHAMPSGYIPPAVHQPNEPLTESIEALRQRYTIPTANQSAASQVSQDHRDQPQLNSHILFKRLGTAHQTDISNSFQHWYAQFTTDSSKSAPLQSPSNSNFAVYEVSTLATVGQRISEESLRFQQLQHAPNPVPQSQSVTTPAIQPFRDQNYVPKSAITRSTQLSQLSHHTTSANQETLSQPIPGLKPPPTRRNKPTPNQTTQTSSSKNHPPALPLSTGQFLDSDTLAFFEHRRSMAQLEDGNGLHPAHGQLNPPATTKDSPLDNENDLYDIYEVYTDITTEEEQKLLHSIKNGPTDGDNHQPDVAFVLPNSEIDYVLAKAQFDGFDNLFADFHNFSQNLLSFNNVHDEFVHQFTKPRIQQYHIDHYFDQTSLGENHRSVDFNPNRVDDDQAVEIYERCFYDDDYHPDFDSDMDYPDQSAGEEEDDDSAPKSSRNKGDTFVSMFDRFKRSQKGYDESDDDYDNPSNDAFRYGGKPGAQEEDIDDAEDPLLREFILMQQMKYKHNLEHTSHLMGEMHKLPGQSNHHFDDDDNYDDSSPHRQDGEKITFIRADDDFCDDEERNQFGIRDGVDESSGDENETRAPIDFTTLMQDDHEQPPPHRNVFADGLDDDDFNLDDDDDDPLFRQFAHTQQEGDLYGGSNAFQQFQKGRPVNYDQ